MGRRLTDAWGRLPRGQTIYRTTGAPQTTSLPEVSGLLGEAFTEPADFTHVHGIDLPTAYLRHIRLQHDDFVYPIIASPANLAVRPQQPPRLRVLPVAYPDLAALRSNSPATLRAPDTTTSSPRILEATVGEGFLASGHVRAAPGSTPDYEVRLDAVVYYPHVPGHRDRLAAPPRRAGFPVVVIAHGNHPALEYRLRPRAGATPRLEYRLRPRAGATPGTEPAWVRVPVIVIDADPTGLRAEIPSHRGYTYLQETLARAGIVSVSMSHNIANRLGSFVQTRAEMILGCLDHLRRLNRDPGSPFHGKLDLNRVGLLGHSRGGDAVVAAANLNRRSGRSRAYGIQAVVSLAPTDLTGLAAPPVPRFRMRRGVTGGYLVVYGSHDGDVIPHDPLLGLGPAWGPTGTGFRHYDWTAVQRAMVFIHRASHNRFNRVWVDASQSLPSASPRSRSLLSQKADPNHSPPEIAALLSPGAHERLAKEYIGGWFRFWLNRVYREGRLFTGLQTNAEAAEASLQFVIGTRLKRLDQFDDQGLMSSFVGRITGIAGITAAFLPVDSPARFPHLDYALKATSPSSRITFQVDTPHRDFSRYSQITFRMTRLINAGTSAILAAGDIRPDFQITLTDGAGRTAVVRRVDVMAENRHIVPPIFRSGLDLDEDGTSDGINVTLLPYQTWRCSFTRFQTATGFDLRNVVSLGLRVSATSAEPVYVDTLTLVA
jgi:hypothetical protein